MLYLLFVVTFLAGILFYGMSPHDKSLDMTAHQAEGMIISFINQHQAAKDYLYTWLGADNDATTGNLQNDNFLKPDFNKMELSLNKGGKEFGLTSDMCTGNTGVPGQEGKESCFVSQVVRDGEKYYVMTYGGWADGNFNRPDWWPRPGNRMRRFESWRKAMALRTRGSISCGTLFKEGDNWCIDNGETQYKNESTHTTCMNQVPAALINELPLPYRNDLAGVHDLLFCYSEFKQGVNPGHYAVTPTYFYDGLSNAGVGKHKTSKEANGSYSWVDLIDSSRNPITTVSQLCSTAPCFTLTNITTSGMGNNVLTTNMPVSSSYTITILSKIDSTQDFELIANTVSVSGEEKPLFIQEKNCSADNISGVCFKLTGTTHDVWFTSYNPYNKLISWTIVVDSGEIRIYENAVLRHEGDNPTLSNSVGNDTFKMQANDTNGAYIYGLRYYNLALTSEQIQKNFKVDQKRFGIPDINNGNINSKIPVEHEEEE